MALVTGGSVQIRPWRRGHGWEISIKARLDGRLVEKRGKSPKATKSASEAWAFHALEHWKKAGAAVPIRYIPDPSQAHLTADVREHHSVEEALDAWLDRGTTLGWSGRPWSARYAKEAKGLVRRLSVMRWGGKELGLRSFAELPSIAPALLRHLKVDLGRSASTVNAYLEAMSGALRAARANGWTDRIWELPPKLSTQSRDAWLTTGDLLALREACKQCDQPERTWAMIVLAARAGLRLGELRALRWNDLGRVAAETRDEVWVPRLRVGSNLPANLSGHDAVKAPKNGCARVVPLHPDVASALAAWRRKSEARTAGRLADDAFIFGSARGDAPIGARSIGRAVTEAVERAQITCMRTDRTRGTSQRSDAAVSPHVLRHTFATHLREHGVGTDDIGELLGHTDAHRRITQHYVHAALDERLTHLAGAVDKLPPLDEVDRAHDSGDHRPASTMTLADLDAHGRSKTTFGDKWETSAAKIKKGQRSRWPSGLRQQDSNL